MARPLVAQLSLYLGEPCLCLPVSVGHKEVLTRGQDHREWEKETGGESFDFYGDKKATVPTRLARNVISAGIL